MKKITPQQFLLRQPGYPEAVPSDKFYLDLANALLDDRVEARLFPDVDDEVIRRTALCVVGWYQDIVADGGLWRGFISECRRLYGRPVPFQNAGEDYVDYEINEIDVRFLVWYAIAMLSEPHRLLSPHSPEVGKLASLWFGRLDAVYDEAPQPEGYNIAFELDIKDPEDSKAIARLSQWLFLHSWLITPSFALTLSELATQAEVNKEGGDVRLADMLEEAMSELPIGPLALYLREWLWLIIHDTVPTEVPEPVGADASPHKYYVAVTAATGGRDIVYIPDYDALSRFFTEVLGWSADEEHLPQFKQSTDFVVMVHPRKGMLLARGVAKCIADPLNPLYDKDYAQTHAINLLTVRGLCPPDLLQRVIGSGWLPDARFPGDSADDDQAVAWADFIARCYLQLYYRGD